MSLSHEPQPFIFMETISSSTIEACMFVEHTPSNYLSFLADHANYFFRAQTNDIDQANYYLKCFPSSFTVLYCKNHGELCELTKALESKTEDQYLVAILEATPNQDELVQLIDLGIQGFIGICPPPEEILVCFRKVTNKGLYVTPSFQERDLDWFQYQLRKPTDHSLSVDRLTKTEKKIFFMLAQGKTSREIAEITSNSVRTIQNHRYRIREKLGIKGYNQLPLVAKDYLNA